MKKIYNSPLMEKIVFEKNDVLTLSEGSVYSGDNVSFDVFNIFQN